MDGLTKLKPHSWGGARESFRIPPRKSQLACRILKSLFCPQMPHLPTDPDLKVVLVNWIKFVTRNVSWFPICFFRHPTKALPQHGKANKEEMCLPRRCLLQNSNKGKAENAFVVLWFEYGQGNNQAILVLSKRVNENNIFYVRTTEAIWTSSSASLEYITIISQGFLKQ